MNLDEFARRIAADNSDYSIGAAKDAINTVMCGLRDALVEGEEFRYLGFGGFLRQIRPGRKTYSNLTHSEIEIPTRVTIKFKPAVQFKNDLNDNESEKGLV